MMMTISECAAWLQARDNFLILTHRRPDGDTLGSAAVLCRGLRSMGKIAHIWENPEITDNYRHLHAGLTKPAADAGDTIVCVDVASEGMLPSTCKGLCGSISLRIDHHFCAASFTEEELVDHTAGACGEIVYDLLMALGVVLDKPMAEALYTAVSTDTGCFRYANTTAHSLRTAAACAEAGADLYPINQALFDTNSLPKLRLQGWIAENTRFLTGGKLAVCALPKAVEAQLGVTEDDMENISGFPRSIAGVEMAATLRETEDGLVKISVRAIPGYDASAVCACFGGGGHKGAAGASVKLPLSDAAAAVEKAMLEVCR
ncbi:MAG: phosphoesterase RecJ domain-containing protein [Ruminococcaceae bacterium]|nr:phosphoesterase RecJ domain-containing protein [Oscillospiraceae bacterium]